jgi:hypothetical protein
MKILEKKKQHFVIFYQNKTKNYGIRLKRIRITEVHTSVWA